MRHEERNPSTLNMSKRIVEKTKDMHPRQIVATHLSGYHPDENWDCDEDYSYHNITSALGYITRTADDILNVTLDKSDIWRILGFMCVWAEHNDDETLECWNKLALEEEVD